MLKNKIAIRCFALSFVLGSSLNVYAGVNEGDLDGRYMPKRGWVESAELHPGESTGQQVGSYKVVLKRQGWNALSVSEQERVRKRLVVRGVFHGLIENALTAAPIISHQLSNQDRDGAMFTQNDESVLLGVESCLPAGVEMPGVATYTIRETLNIEYGSGVYQALQVGGSIVLEGTVNVCTSQNDFEVVGGAGGLCFGSCD